MGIANGSLVVVTRWSMRDDLCKTFILHGEYGGYYLLRGSHSLWVELNDVAAVKSGAPLAGDEIIVTEGEFKGLRVFVARAFPESVVEIDGLKNALRLESHQYLLLQKESEIELDQKAGLKDCGAVCQAPRSNGPISVQSVVRINGRDASSYSDSELYDIIRAEELKIAHLGEIKNKPKRLQQEIDDRVKGIATLVVFMDSPDNWTESK